MKNIMKSFFPNKKFTAFFYLFLLTLLFGCAQTVSVFAPDISSTPSEEITESENGANEMDKSKSPSMIRISATKMNVFYVGVENPIKIDLEDGNYKELKVSISGGGGGTIRKEGGQGYYTVRVTKPAPLKKECEVNVEIGGKKETARFRVKRIPNPVAKLSNKSSGMMGAGEFKAQGGVIAILENFDFDARCQIMAFTLTRIANDGTKTEVINKGSRFSTESRKLVNKAERMDMYLFDNVKAKCPGDPAGRKINSMIFKIR